jgi:threonine synthase
MQSFVTTLQSAMDGTELPADRPQTVHAGRPLWVRYDLDAIGRAIDRKKLAARPANMWRYRELLPLSEGDEIVTLGEEMTPLLECPRLAARLGVSKLLIKDESHLPTGSFKSRGLAMAVTLCARFGLSRLAIPTAGNAGGALAAYAARAGMEAYVFMPEDTPLINQRECALAGARTFLVRGLITDCGRIVREGAAKFGWFDLSTLREPYRLEGKKTMGLELAEQMGWELPDVIVYPTGGGTGLIGMWKAFAELCQLGWLAEERLPRMVAVQSNGCCPIVRAFASGARHAEPFENAATIASGLRVPAAVGDFMILDAVRASGGRAVAVEERCIREWMRLAMSSEGIPICPEAGACVGAIKELRAQRWIRDGERVVLFNTGAAQKYLDACEVALPLLEPEAVDWAAIQS